MRCMKMKKTILLAAAGLVALVVLSFVGHFLFSPWLLVAAIGVLAWIRFRPRRSRQ